MMHQEDHDAFFKANGVHWTELVHLPYFNLICCTIIDPMHNLLLGNPFASKLSQKHLSLLCKQCCEDSVVCAIYQRCWFEGLNGQNSLRAQYDP
jgi:hypothetical protein